MTLHQHIKGLAEVAIRVNDLAKMEKFYCDIIGLPVLKRFPSGVFLQIAQKNSGHPQALVLFDRQMSRGGSKFHQKISGGVSSQHSTLDHFALEIELDAYQPTKQHLESLGLNIDEQVFSWISCRSMFVHDPEGNILELVCHDPGLISEEK